MLANLKRGDEEFVEASQLMEDRKLHRLEKILGTFEGNRKLEGKVTSLERRMEVLGGKADRILALLEDRKLDWLSKILGASEGNRGLEGKVTSLEKRMEVVDGKLDHILTLMESRVKMVMY